jgi:hypothetical protein
MMVNDRRGLEAERAECMLVPDTQAELKVLAATEALVESPNLAKDGDLERSIGCGKGVDGSPAGWRCTRVTKQVAREPVRDVGTRGQVDLERCQRIVTLEIAAKIAAV